MLVLSRFISFVIFCAVASLAAEDGAAPLQKALASIEWKRIIQPIPQDAGFQASVRQIYPVLKLEAQAKVTETIKSVSAGNGLVTSNTPIDQVWVKHISAKLTPLILNDAAKRQLAVIESSGDLDALLKLLGGGGMPPVGGSAAAAPAMPDGSLAVLLPKSTWTWGGTKEGALSRLTFGSGKTLQINNDPPHRWKQIDKLKLQWDDGSIMTFSDDLGTFEVETPSGKRYGRKTVQQGQSN
jgi:hypothetical protein